MILKKTNLMLFATILVITNTTVAMDIDNNNNKSYNVSISNRLTQSTVMARVCEQNVLNGMLFIQYSDHEINPQQCKQLSLIPQNNVSYLKLLLPECYRPPFIDVTVTQNDETIFIMSLYCPKEKRIEICQSSSLILRSQVNNIREAFISPAKYHFARQLALTEFEKITLK